MLSLTLQDFHQSLNATFLEVRGSQIVRDYGDSSAEYRALAETAALLDLSFRSRLCLTGADRLSFLNGQVTNNLKDLAIGEGCYAALVNAKGRMQSDLNIYRLTDELLLDFEPGYEDLVQERLAKYIIIEDVQIVKARPHYGLLSIQGPQSREILSKLPFAINPPEKPFFFSLVNDPIFGEIYIVSNPRTGTVGYDLFVPQNSLEQVSALLLKTPCLFAGWLALEARRIELGIPRFGADMDETTLPPEAHLEKRAISYTKGCYIGQEVIARLRNYGQASKTLRGLLLPHSVKTPPVHGDKITRGEKDVGVVTSATLSPRLGRWIGLGYVRREIISHETELCLRQATGEIIPLQLTDLPFA